MLHPVSWSFFIFLLALQGLKIIDLQMNNYLRILEQAIQFGHPVLLQNVQEYLDPTLNPVLNKSVAHVGQRLGSLWAWIMGQVPGTSQTGCERKREPLWLCPLLMGLALQGGLSHRSGYWGTGTGQPAAGHLGPTAFVLLRMQVASC